MPHFDIVHDIIPYLEPTLRKQLRTIHETALRIVMSSSLMVYSYWSISVSISSHHCWWSAARCQAEWMSMLKGWTSLETVFSHVSQGRPLGLLHPVGGLLLSATRTL